MKKATHKGTCQLCGRLQRLPNGTLSKHGYTVQWGWFEGTCPGSGGRPYEESTDLIEEQIRRTNGRILEAQEEIGRVEALSLKAIAVVRLRERGKYQTYERKEEVKVEVVEEEREDDYIRRRVFIDDNGERGEVMIGRGYKGLSMGYNSEYETAEQAAEVLSSREIRSLKGHILKLTDYVEWLTDRKNNWKPGELISVL